ncbi:MAG: Do family serine endopeptidase [Agarilytica sp.]
MKVMRISLVFCFVSFFVFAGKVLALGSLPDFTELIEDKSPAVVKINTTTKRKTQGLRLPPGQQIPDIFRHFLDPRDYEQRDMHSMGSGFFISADGYVLTNNHVIEDADEIVVRLTDRREYKAELIGADPTSDLALLKVKEKGLPYLSLAEKDGLKVGEWVVAIGSPFGLDFSASAGIVSAKGRSIPNQQGDYVPFIQTDVAINPGNSGGPLFNLDGRVVGVNSQIYTQSGGSIGLSFAIPSTVAKNVVAQLKKKGRVDRGWLGVVIQEVDKNLAESFGLNKPRGALVAKMEEGGPAEKSGLKEGDIILEFDGVEIVARSDLPHVVGLVAPGVKVPVVVMRKGKRTQLRVKVGARGGKADEIADSSLSDPQRGDRIGVVVGEVDSAELRRLRIKGGVRVLEVDERGAASEAGVEKGDIIVQIGFEELRSVGEYEGVVDKLPKETLLPIRFFKKGQPVFRTIMLNR